MKVQRHHESVEFTRTVVGHHPNYYLSRLRSPKFNAWRGEQPHILSPPRNVHSRQAKNTPKFLRPTGIPITVATGKTGQSRWTAGLSGNSHPPPPSCSCSPASKPPPVQVSDSSTTAPMLKS